MRLSVKTPLHPPFKNAQMLDTVLEAAFDKTGLKPPQK